MTSSGFAGGAAAGGLSTSRIRDLGRFAVRPLVLIGLTAASALAVCGVANAQSASSGVTRGADGTRILAAPVQSESDPITVEIEHGAQSFYFTAPYRQKVPERTPFTNQHAVGSAPGQTVARIRQTDLSIGWRYRSSLHADPAISVTYNVQATFDVGENDTIGAYGRREYLTRMELARDLGAMTSRLEVGQRHSVRSPFDAQTGRSAFAAAGVSYRFSARSTIDAYYDHETATLAGLPALRSLSLNFSQRLSSRADVSLYAFRSLSEDKAYNAGVRMTVQF